MRGSTLNMNPFSKILIYGLGLIGGSLALALRNAFPDVYIYGAERDKNVLRQAKRRGIIDASVTGLKEICDCDLIILATPINKIIATLAEIGRHAKPGSVITDVGSTKVDICRAAQRHFPANVYFIGGHPMTGKERSGLEASDEQLFLRASYLLCPNGNVPKKTVGAFVRFIKAIKAKPLLIDPETHDRLVAYTSHLPQILSTSLANLLVRKGSEEAMIRLSADGLRDMVRLACSSYTVWKDICQTNQTNLQGAIEEYVTLLTQIKTRLASADLAKHFSNANKFCRSYTKLKKSTP